MGKIIENYHWQEDADKGLALVEGFLTVPGTIAGLTEEQILRLWSAVLQYGDKKDFEFLFPQGKLRRDSHSLEAAYYNPENTKSFVQALLKNPHSQEGDKKSEFFKRNFDRNFFANPYEALESLAEFDEEYLTVYLFRCLSDKYLSSFDAMSAFRILLSYKNLNDIETALQYSSVKCDFLLEDKNYPVLLGDLLKNPDREVFNTYFPILYEFNPSVMQKAIWDLKENPFIETYIKQNAIPPITVDSKRDQNDYEEYKRKLQEARNREIGNNLKPFLSPKDRVSLIDIALNETPYLEKGQMYRLDKLKTKGPRTLMVHRLDTGEYRVIVDTKSKTASNEEKTYDVSKGSSKKGKNAFDLITEEALFTLAQSPVTLKKAIILGKEVSLARNLKSKRIHVPYLGRFFKKKGKIKISSYALALRVI